MSLHTPRLSLILCCSVIWFCCGCTQKKADQAASSAASSGLPPLTPPPALPESNITGSGVRLSPDKPHIIPALTSVEVELLCVLDSSFSRPGFLGGALSSDVRETDGRIVLPAGTPVTLALREVSRNGPISRMVLGLDSVTLGGRQYSLTNGNTSQATVTFTEDAGQGPAHAAVHLHYGYPLSFVLNKAVDLR